MTQMTMRERMLAVVQGREHDRVPFEQYSGLAGPDEQIWAEIGRENMGLIRWSSVHQLQHPNCSSTSEQIDCDGKPGVRNVLHTPAGDLTQVRLREPVFGTTAAHKHYVTDPEDYEALLAHLHDTVVVADLEHFLRDRDQLGEDGLPMVSVSRTPYQQLWVQWVGLQDLCLHLVDCPDIVGACTAEMQRIQRQEFDVVSKAVDEVGVPFVDFPDNITAPVIGERYFRQYCVPAYNELGAMLEDRGVPVYCHMDGDLKALWGAMGESKLRGIDSMSPPPDNDTSVGQVVAMWPEMRMHINYPSSVHLWEPDAIYEHTRGILEEGGHSGRLIIQISENVPPGVWRRSFPQIVRAIDNFGRP